MFFVVFWIFCYFVIDGVVLIDKNDFVVYVVYRFWNGVVYEFRCIVVYCGIKCVVDRGVFFDCEVWIGYVGSCYFGGWCGNEMIRKVIGFCGVVV